MTFGRGGGRGNEGRSRGGRGRGNYHATTGRGGDTATSIKPKGKAPDYAPLLGHVFDYGHKGTADQMRTTWEKITDHVGITLTGTIAEELRTRIPVEIPRPEYTNEIKASHVKKEARRKENIQRTLAALTIKLKTTKEAPSPDPVEIATLEDKSALLTDELEEDNPIVLTGEALTEHVNKWKTHGNLTEKLTLHRGQAYSIILAQCTQILKDKFKTDPTWATVEKSRDPLSLYTLIEKIILSQIGDDTFPYAIVCTPYVS
jgi:hypothetical protein